MDLTTMERAAIVSLVEAKRAGEAAAADLAQKRAKALSTVEAVGRDLDEVWRSVCERLGLGEDAKIEEYRLRGKTLELIPGKG